ncbi:MAG: HEPN domain-containing protein [Candidatus Babeliales bacterium]|jgi:HEPN domain-containing protein
MQEHERWITIAKEDLAVAKALLSQEFFTPLTYHCQQAAEKALKSYLIFKKQEILKTHDLGKLIELCKKFDNSFATLDHAAAQLNPFSSKFRYPSEEEIPDLTDAKLAITHAQSIMVFVVKKIANPATGQSNIF